MAKSSKLSKMAANRLAVTATVASSVQVHGAEVVEALHTALFPGGRERPELTRKFLEGLGGLLTRAATEVERSDLAHAIELLDDEEPRLRRDTTFSGLTTLLLGHRDTLGALYGTAVVRDYGLAEALPTTPTQLIQRARSIVSQYRKRPLTAPPLRAGVTIKLAVLAAELEGAVEQLSEALGDVRRETREAQLTQERKNQANEAWSTAYAGVTHAFYGLYLLAGRRDLADRIEPTARRRAGLPEAPDVEDHGGTPAPRPEADPVPMPGPDPAPAP